MLAAGNPICNYAKILNSERYVDDVFLSRLLDLFGGVGEIIRLEKQDVLNSRYGDDMYTAEDHTFVVCAYKENPYLSETIQSLKEQTEAGRIILSTSTPSDYLRSVCSKFEIPMVVNPHPHLAGDDWNYAYDSAETSLVTLAHQDDYYAPTFLARVLEQLNQKGGRDALLSFTDYFEIREGKHVHTNSILRIKRVMNSPLRYAELNGRPWVKKRVLSLGDSICCPAVTLVKDNVGSSPFDTTYINSCDYKTWVDLARRPGSFVYIPECLMGHRIYPESATTKNLAGNIRRGEDLEILSSLWPSPVARIINRLYALSEGSNKL